MTRSLGPIGLGTWSMHDETCTRAVERALDVGYRHIDTAQLYDNERAVGAGLARSDVPREEVIVATKVDPERLGREELLESVAESRDRLGVGTVDLLYVHWPRAAYDPDETLPALDEVVDRGLVEQLGLSNFTPALLDAARDRLDAPVAAHQFECHPLLPQEALRAYGERHGIASVAYSPLANGRALDLEPVRLVAERHDATPAQVVVAWCHAKGVVPIPKATGGHIAENYAGTQIELEDEDVDHIDAIPERVRLVDPESAPWN